MPAIKNALYLFLVIFSLVLLHACKKDAAPAQHVQETHYDLEKGLLDFSISGELQAAMIDTIANTITVPVPESANQHHLNTTISIADGVSAKLNNTAATSAISYDFTQPVTLTLSSSKSPQTLTFKIIVENEMQFFGLYGTMVNQKSLNKSYNFYYDQFDGSAFQAINCGPAVTTMAIKWADSTFNKTPAYARSLIRPQGGWWFTGDVSSYLGENGISSSTDTLVNIDSLVKTNIDHNNLLIFCLDMYYVPQNPVDYQHTQKFYEAGTVGWGHFLLVKGYKQVSTGFYLEVYDPYAHGVHYPGFDNAQIKGRDRYYLADDIRASANIWWPYVITVAQKGQKASKAGRLQMNSLGKQRPIPEASGR